jgi:hypothetical protein
MKAGQEYRRSPPDEAFQAVGNVERPRARSEANVLKLARQFLQSDTDTAADCPGAGDLEHSLNFCDDCDAP